MNPYNFAQELSEFHDYCVTYAGIDYQLETTDGSLKFGRQTASQAVLFEMLQALTEMVNSTYTTEEIETRENPSFGYGSEDIALEKLAKIIVKKPMLGRLAWKIELLKMAR